MPGCATITEVITAMEAGADIVKIFLQIYTIPKRL